MTKPSKAGRKGKYHDWISPAGLSKVRKWSRDGLIDREIAERIGIAEGTLYDWMNRFPEFSEAIKEEKAAINAEAEDLLIKTLRGYEYEEVKTIIEKDEEGNQKTKVERSKRFMPPNVTSLIFFLKNRMPDEWRDRHEHRGSVNVNHTYEEMTEEDLKEMAKAYADLLKEEAADE